jgi:drug/metabolite transporter (DMT)-like permease
MGPSASRYPIELQPATTPQFSKHQTRALLMVFCCTLIGAASQILIKLGTRSLGEHPSMVATALGIFTVPMLFAGYALLGFSTVLFVLALRRGELSLLYPVFTLTYVWVTVLSVKILHESMNNLKIAGLVTIMAGVAVLGRASRQ